MPRPRWKPAEELTPFARLLREGYMWKRTPNINLSELADITGISKQTIWRWLNTDSVPRQRSTLLRLHETTGIPLQDLYAAANVSDPEEDAWESIERCIAGEDRLPADKREKAVAYIHELRMEYRLDTMQDEPVTDQ